MKPRALAPVIVVASLVLATAWLGVLHRPLAVSAAPGTGSITGQVVWSSSGPVPYGVAVPGQSSAGQATPGGVDPDHYAPGASPDGASNAGPGAVAPEVAGGIPVPGLPVRPGPAPRPIPAGAVLVAVQGTALSARTDERGRFRIDNVPTGQYLTVAAGPVAGVAAAASMRPNVFIRSAGDTVDVGRLYLGQSYHPYYGPVPYGATPGATSPDTATPDDGQP